jgi:hypothetical protein
MTTITKSKRKNSGDRSELVIALVIVGGFVALLVLGVFLANRPRAEAALEYDGEIVRGRTLTAVHDMGEGEPIPFLPAGGPQPNVEMAEAFYDFGRIGAKDVVTRTFVVRNTGDAPLTISRAYTTCGCTTAEISADEIPPGKAVTVELRFDAGFHDSAGQTVRRGVILENNDPDQPQTEIWVQAEVGNK